jgi:hypothetical protein
MAVAPYGTELQDLIFGPAQEHFLNQAGKPLPLPITGSQPVRLAFVDTAATRETDPENFKGTSSHGFSLINMAEQMLCDGPDCLAQVTAQLALVYEWPRPGCAGFNRRVNNPDCRNVTEGGNVGLISELAQAIYRETDRWLDVAPPGQRLVINLSVGWLPLFGGGETVANMPANVQAVYRALEQASCRGALVLAAAGNAKNGPSESVGPLYPAAWEQFAAPRGAACFQALGGPPPVPLPPPAGDRRSIVYAVGGVRDNGQPLFNSREQGEPRMAAFGDHAVVVTPPVSGVTQSTMLTGTSVSTAVVSAAAAAVWYYQPGLAPHEVIDFVYGSGPSLGRDADFCRTGTPANPCPLPVPVVRQVSVCAAADAACATGGPFCPGPGFTCPAPAPLDLSGVDFASFVQTAETVSIESLDQTLTDPACVDEVIYYLAGTAPVNPCPHEQYHGVWAETWQAGGQPGSHPCPACTTTYSSPGTFYIEIDGEFAGDLSEPVLKCAGDVFVLPLTEPISAGYKGVVTEVPCQALSPVELSFTVDGDQSVTSPMLNLD